MHQCKRGEKFCSLKHRSKKAHCNLIQILFSNKLHEGNAIKPEIDSTPVGETSIRLFYLFIQRLRLFGAPRPPEDALLFPELFPSSTSRPLLLSSALAFLSISSQSIPCSSNSSSASKSDSSDSSSSNSDSSSSSSSCNEVNLNYHD